MKLFKILRALWVLAAVSILAITLYYYGDSKNSDIDIFLFYGSMAISFPSGPMVMMAIGYFMMYATPDKIYHESHYTLIIWWIALNLPGYIQWFVLMPRLIKRFRKP